MIVYANFTGTQINTERIVRQNDERVNDLDQHLPDPILEEFARLNRRIEALEAKLKIKATEKEQSILVDNEEVLEKEDNKNA